MLSPLPGTVLPSRKAPRPAGKAASRTVRAVAAEEEVGAVVMLKVMVLQGWDPGIRRRVWWTARPLA
jgi:hypothetical protein